MLNREDLHGYQEKGVAHIHCNTGYALFLKAGMGKTVTTLTAIADLYDIGEVNRVLVVAPNKVINLDTWQNEIKNWEHVSHLDYAVAKGTATQRIAAVQQKKTITFINWENIVWLIKTFGKKWPFDMVVLDESSKAKNPKTATFRALKAVRAITPRVLLLTGSPAANSMLNLWSQLYLVDFGQRLGKTYTGYQQQYFDKSYTGYQITIKDGQDKVILDKISDVCISLDDRDYLDIPEVIEIKHDIELSEKDMAAYLEFEKHQILTLTDDEEDEDAPVITAVNAAVLCNKLLQFTSGAAYVGEEKTVHRFHEAKLDELADIIDEADGDPILLAYYYKHEIARIKERFPHVVVLDNNPETLARWNRGEIAVLAANPASAGHGINAQKGGNTLVWFSYPNWDLELYEQFTKRLVRQGQTKSFVVVHHLIVHGTNDQRVLNSLSDKDAQQQKIFDSLKARVEEVLQTERGETV